MILNFKKSKQYIAVLLGGLPADTDKVVELVADSRQRLSFIYGFNVFVLYFYSDKNIADIEKVFLTTLKQQVDMIFVFRNTKRTVQHMAPHVKLKMESAQTERNNVIGGDVNALRDVLTALSMQMQMMPVMPIAQNSIPQEQRYQQQPQEQPYSEEDTLNQLLMKMKATGYSSLTPAELDFLKSYKEKHKKNDQNDQKNVD